uniref:Uncharacterized protein n=1 Tax=Lygus hesperus TaxID=30085 RepID=A0A146MED7_LYGHE
MTAEGVQNMFIRKLFRLPGYAPNYILLLETELDPVSAYTLEQHQNYLVKVAKLPDTRLPKIVARELIAKDLDWAKHWSLRTAKYGIPNNLATMDPSVLRSDSEHLLARYKEEKRSVAWERVEASEKFTLYRNPPFTEPTNEVGQSG